LKSTGSNIQEIFEKKSFTPLIDVSNSSQQKQLIVSITGKPNGKGVTPAGPNLAEYSYYSLSQYEVRGLDKRDDATPMELQEKYNPINLAANYISKNQMNDSYSFHESQQMNGEVDVVIIADAQGNNKPKGRRKKASKLVETIVIQSDAEESVSVASSQASTRRLTRSQGNQKPLRVKPPFALFSIAEEKPMAEEVDDESLVSLEVPFLSQIAAVSTSVAKPQSSSNPSGPDRSVVNHPNSSTSKDMTKDTLSKSSVAPTPRTGIDGHLLVGRKVSKYFETKSRNFTYHK
jgi:hypothetical protein